MVLLIRVPARLCLPLTHQGLVLDDNRLNAAMALAFNSTACTYRFQQPVAFYECRLVQLQWWRTANSLRWVGQDSRRDQPSFLHRDMTAGLWRSPALHSC